MSRTNEITPSSGVKVSKVKNEDTDWLESAAIARRVQAAGLRTFTVHDAGLRTYNIVLHGQIEFKTVEELSMRLTVNRIMANGHLLQINVELKDSEK